MNLPYIQSELFHELVSMEPLLKPEYRFCITKCANDLICVSLYWILAPYLHKWLIDPCKITKGEQITAEINRIWDAIPAECKRDDILK